MKTFTVESSEMVIEKDITFYSTVSIIYFHFMESTYSLYSGWKSRRTEQTCAHG